MTVYVVGCEGSRLVKIGFTEQELKTRLNGISQMSAHPIKVLWESGPEHGRETEGRLHRLFAGYRHHGEWFDFGPVDSVALVSVAVDLPDPIERERAKPVKRQQQRPKQQLELKALARSSVRDRRACRCGETYDYSKFDRLMYEVVTEDGLWGTLLTSERCWPIRFVDSCHWQIYGRRELEEWYARGEVPLRVQEYSNLR